MKCSGENVVIRGIVREVSCFPLHFMLYRVNLDYFSDSVFHVILFFSNTVHIHICLIFCWIFSIYPTGQMFPFILSASASEFHKYALQQLSPTVSGGVIHRRPITGGRYHSCVSLGRWSVENQSNRSANRKSPKEN